MIRKRRAFSLFELIIVIIIFSIVLGFVFVKVDLFNQDTKTNNLYNIKQTLLDYQFKNNIHLKCSINKKCFLFIDDALSNEKINLSISDDLEIYNYNTNFERIIFKDIEPKELSRYEIVFELKLYKDGKNKEFIAYENNKFFVFNSLYLKPLVFDDRSDLEDYFYELQQEVKQSAF